MLGCPPREPQSNSQPFWQTHFCPMLLCLITVAVPDSRSLCCIHLNFSLASTCVCSPFPVCHCEGLGCLSWSRQHRGTACRAVLAHSDAGFSAKVKSGKRPFPKYAGLSQKMERQISGLGDPQAVGFKTKMSPGTARKHSQWGSALRTGVGSTGALLAFARHRLADGPSCTKTVVWTIEKWD